MIINLRGTSGSGKTTVVRALMAKYPAIEPLMVADERGREKIHGYECRMANFPGNPPNLYVVGSYKNVCGGCDGIKTQDEICNRVRNYAGLAGDVVFEGLLISHLFSRYVNLDREMSSTNSQQTIWAFLDTPEQVCVDRVKARREQRFSAKCLVADEKGRVRPEHPGPLNEKNTRQKWNDMRRVFQKCTRDGLDARWVNHENPTAQVWGWMRG